MRKLIGFLTALIVVGCLAIGYMYFVALRDPIVRRASVAMSDWPPGARPVRILLLTDTHVGGPDMPPARLAKIVRRLNGLKPDLVLVGGDFVSDKRSGTQSYNGARAVAPLQALAAPLGVYAVLGNHDHWRGVREIAASLRRAHIQLLVNQAIAVGPLSLGGTDDAFTHNDDLTTTVAAMRRLKGARVLLSHSPDIVPAVPDDVTLILAGHTHCGQIRLPWIGALSTMSNYGDRFACGLGRDGAKRVFTSAGLGTSIVPLRIGAVPDVWLLTLGPARGRGEQRSG